MNLESTVRKLSLGIAGLSLAATLSCSSEQYSKAGSSQPVTPVVHGEYDVLPSSHTWPPAGVAHKVRVIAKHYHKQFSEKDLYQYYIAEWPATKNMSFESYQKRFQKRNHVYQGWKIDIIKLEDLNGNNRVGSKDYFP